MPRRKRGRRLDAPPAAQDAVSSHDPRIASATALSSSGSMLPGERYGCPLVLEADYASGLVMFREFWHVPIPVGKAISDHYEEIAGNRLCEKVEGVPLARQDTWQGPVCRAVVGEELQAQQ